MGIDVVTFGCRLNPYESEVMRREATAAGLGELKDGAPCGSTVLPGARLPPSPRRC